VAARRRWWTREAGLTLALLLPLGALAVAGASARSPRHASVRAADNLAARVPSVGTLRTPRARDVAAPGTLPGSIEWAFSLVAVACASAACRRVDRARLAARLRTRAPPELRFV